MGSTTRSYHLRLTVTGDDQANHDGVEARHGGAFYDQPEVFAHYREHRAWPQNPNNTLEEPAFLDELGNIAGLRILDLGCGDGSTAITLLNAGCASYLGIDGSALMIEAANAALTGRKARAVLGDLEDFESQPGAFDLIVSRMALHYLAHISLLLRRCHQSLAAGGRIVFTVTHPVITSHDGRANTTEPRQDWLMDNYFDEGARPQVWLGAESVWLHRTIETYVTELRHAGFSLTNLRECAPQPDRFDDDREYQRRRRIPLMLLLSGTRD
jgi:cyclopropane fatty-acyl-phospholipid synthase-like methyltransferase